MRQPGEPSVEEILDSIKKVIARDNRPDTRRPREETLMPQRAAPAQDSVLDLGASADFLDDEEGETPAPAAEALVTDAARSSMRESLAALAMMAQPAAQPQIVRSGETSLEGMVRELLKPALAEWLDRNLPAMVERLVAEEIARIVGKKG